MLTLLSRILGPHRAVSVYAFAQTRGMALLGALFLALIVLGLWAVTSDEENRHEAYMTVPVLTATPIAGSAENGVVASVRLPDGKAASVTTKIPSIARSVTETACIEKRVYVSSGEAFYKLQPPELCGG